MYNTIIYRNKTYQHGREYRQGGIFLKTAYKQQQSKQAVYKSYKNVYIQMIKVDRLKYRTIHGNHKHHYTDPQEPNSYRRKRLYGLHI